MKLLKAAAAIVTLGVSGAVFATPIYYGDTDSASPLLGDTRENSNETGYFIWNDESSPKDWSMRWTADQNGTLEKNPTWYGSILFKESNLGTVTEVTFENSNDVLNVSYDNMFLSFNDAIGFTSVTNDTGGIDGIDWNISGNVELMHFALGSSLWDLASCDNCAGTQIYLGDGLAIPNVLITNPSGADGSLQSFEIKVPEPPILALFGLGLAGMGFSARRRKA